jgi:hypothetical protein
MGDITLNMGENQTQLDLFDVVEVDKNAARGFINNGSSDARLLIIKKV